MPDALIGGLGITSGGGEELLRGCALVATGNGAGAFTPGAPLLATDARVDGIATLRLADLDEDGHADLVGADLGSEFDGGGLVGSLSVFYGDGSGGFGPEVPVPATNETIGLQTGDFDGDGHLDLLTATDVENGDGTTDWGHVLFGDGNGGFPDEHLLGGNGLGLVVDLDVDGKPDFVRSSGSGTLVVYPNGWDGRPG